MRSRFVLLVTCLFMFVSFVMTSVASYLDLQDERERVLTEARAISTTVSRLATPLLANAHYSVLEKELESLASSGVVEQAIIFDPVNRTAIDSDGSANKIQTLEANQLAQRAIASGEQEIELKPNLIDIALSVRNASNSDVIGVVFVSTARPPLVNVLLKVWIRNTLIAVTLLAICIPITFHFAGTYTRPIKQLTQQARQVASGDFETKFPVERQDEIGSLARAYSDMVATIRSNLARIHELAFIDPVTRLPNRENFRQYFTAQMTSITGKPNPIALLFIDLDRFRRVNDSFGHDTGDALLKDLAVRIQTLLTDVETEHSSLSFTPQVARLGGDEFTVIIPANEDLEFLHDLADKLVHCVEQPIEIDGHTLTVGASIGVSTYPADGEDFNEILKNAHLAMYSAKKTGGNRAFFFTEVEDATGAKERIRLEAELKRALLRDELIVFFQPKINCVSHSIVGAEALVRWNHPERGILAPGAFIDVAEESDLITRLGDRVLELACEQGKAWLDNGRKIPIAVNVSIRQLEKPGFSRRVLETLDITGFPAELLQLEVTETVAMADPDRLAQAADPLLKAGITFAIDDFGTGYSSLAHLQSLPFNTFKIDRSFVSKVFSDRHSRSIVQTILSMAQNLHYEVVAEGVETHEQQMFLNENGCTIAQGFLFAKPMPADQFDAWMPSYETAPNSNLEDNQSSKKHAGSTAA